MDKQQDRTEYPVAVRLHDIYCNYFSSILIPVIPYIRLTAFKPGGT